MKKTISIVAIAVVIIAIVIFIYLCTRGDGEKVNKNYMKITKIDTLVRGEFYNQFYGNLQQFNLPIDNWEYSLSNMLDLGNINQIQYDDENPWPTEADGLGFSLELSDLSKDKLVAGKGSSTNLIQRI